MRSAPAVTVRAAPSAHWRRALACLCAGTLAATGLWAWQSEEPKAWLVWIAAALLAAHCLRRAWRRGPCTLRWDGERWWVAPQAGGSELSGELSVAIDFGAWLLLRFHAAPSGWRRDALWLPLQRAGLEAHWHALRCAIYSPRPPASPPAAPDSSA
jgi:hypothetical protein